MQQAARTQQGWQIKVKGEVARISKIDVDKSGKNPKYMVRIRLNVESMDDGGFGVELMPQMQAQGKETNLLQQIKQLPTVGEHIVIHSSGFDKRPSLLNINHIEFVS